MNAWNKRLCRLQPLIMSAALGSALAALPLVAHADEWRVDGRVNARTEINDNYYLLNGPHETVYSLGVSPYVNFSSNTEARALSYYVGANGLHTTADQNGHNRVDFMTGAKYGFNGNVDTVSLNADVVRNTAFESELRPTGIVTVQGSSLDVSLSPSWSHNLGGRYATELDSSLDKVHYSGVSNGINYSNYGVDAGGSYLLGERNRLYLLVGQTNYRADVGGVKSDTTNVKVTWKRELSEKESSNITVGGLRSNVTQPDPLNPLNITSRAVNGWLIDAHYVYQLDGQNNFQANVTRKAQPSGTQAILFPRTLLLAYGHRFSETFDSGASFYIVRTKYLSSNAAAANIVYIPIGQYLTMLASQKGGSSLADNNPRYEAFTAHVNWQFHRDQFVEFGIQSAQSRPYASGTDVRQSLVYVTYEYRWPGYAF